MIPNTNPETGIRYGYIKADSLHSEIVDELMYGSQATDLSYRAAWEDHLAEKRNEHDILVQQAESDGEEPPEELDEDAIQQAFNDSFQSDEAIVEGTYEGVKYSSSWLGGALNFFIFESPNIGKFQECSPCVPRAGNLDCPDEDGVDTYDVPADWRDQR